jgi:DNA polymerase/3'-5' exonuclease PolX
VKDIELVLVPKKTIIEDTNLFEEVIATRTVIDPKFQQIVKAFGEVLKGKFTGRYMKIEVKQVINAVEHTINVDMFMPQVEDYYRQLAIRTGSSEYAFRYIACGWRKIGWVGTEDGLRLRKECYQVDEKRWSVKSDVYAPRLPPVWKSEAEFFKWIDVQYLKPEHRNL